MQQPVYKKKKKRKKETLSKRKTVVCFHRCIWFFDSCEVSDNSRAVDVSVVSHRQNRPSGPCRLRTNKICSDTAAPSERSLQKSG